jgi:two-component system LytT family sensor kinase
MVWGMLILLYFAVGLQDSYLRGLHFAVMFTIMQFIVYKLNTRYLIPSYFEKNRQKFIILNTILLLLITSGITLIDLSSRHFLLQQSNPKFIFPVFLHMVLCIVALGFSIGQYLFDKEKATKIEIEELKREKAESELKFLKMQINPHFLFNALNNIYTMTYMGDKSAHEKIAMLSDMLRYVLYDCESDYIPLNKEITYIDSYIEFQQLKTEEKQNITFIHQEENEHYLIAPMLLIPLVENGFKHSKIEKDKSGFVRILLTQAREKLSFEIRNSFFEPVVPSKQLKGKGIGIENVRSRLELLYPGKYVLEIKEDKQEYSVHLDLYSHEPGKKI